jgi:hypothetical protein
MQNGTAKQFDFLPVLQWNTFFSESIYSRGLNEQLFKALTVRHVLYCFVILLQENAARDTGVTLTVTVTVSRLLSDCVRACCRFST